MSWYSADKSYKNRRFSARRGAYAICLHSYSKRVIRESARIPDESRSVSLALALLTVGLLAFANARRNANSRCRRSLKEMKISQNTLISYNMWAHVLRACLYFEPSALGERRKREPAFRRTLANATNTSVRRVRVRVTERDSSEIRADSWMAFFLMCPKPNRKPNTKINTVNKN